ncbi:helix-turn-helix domain-containing protein [Candidatus Mycobacterium wuenschmannii]|uniref:Helix-turn-helix domain-containing protein n=1 Tax=Candidatus Mycobacterium wuenschmannii TaxID=3027808 RepID=A0ABY8W3U6_9MYCO|nr:TetR/AcrR family transcriptional regulator [Candidatus Mycobacterium wuenschmannii]WIM89669.1 helix-turn-helix domain-containing protein [Candidatus Mycobacterium wuenschmannii]
MHSADTPSRERLLDTALELFARRGYAATSTAEIQKATGMSPGSGALYRHFRSKNDVLRAALRRGLDRMRNSQAWRQAITPADRIDALTQVAAAAHQTITENADLVRLMLHEPDAAPDMVDELWMRNMAFAYTTMGHAMRATAAEAGTEIEDPEAVSAVLLAALSYVPVMQVLLGRPPGDMDPERFRAAWLRLSRAVFTHGVPSN